MISTHCNDRLKLQPSFINADFHSSSFIEAAHKTFGHVVHLMTHQFPPTIKKEAQLLVQQTFGQAMHANRAASHASLQCNTPGAVALGRDMHFDLPFAANLIALRQFGQAQVNERLLWANAKRTHHEHAVGQQVCILGPGQPGNKKLT